MRSEGGVSVNGWLGLEKRNCRNGRVQNICRCAKNGTTKPRWVRGSVRLRGERIIILRA